MMPTQSNALRLPRFRLALGLSLTLGFGLTLTLGSGCDSKGDTSPPGGDGGDQQVAGTDAAGRDYPDPPPPSEPRPINFPEIQKFELPNKLQVYVVENHEVPLVSMQLVAKVGDVHDPLLAEFTAELLSEGTKKKTKAQLDESIEQVGGGLSTFSTSYSSYISTSVLEKDLGLAMGILGEVAQTPRFPADALDKIKEAKKSNVLAEKSQGGSLAQRVMSMRLYPKGHPYARNFASDADIDKVTIEEIRQFHETYYQPGNAFLILSGDITPERAEEIAKKTLGRWQPGKPLPAHPLEKFAAEDYQASRPTVPEVHIVDRPSISADIYWANLSMARNHPDWIKMQAVNKVLGGGFGSRLFSDIRETKKLTYNVNSFVAPAIAVGAFAIVTQTKKIDEMLQALRDNVDKIRTTEITDEEFEMATRNMAQSLPLQLELPSQIAGKVREAITYGLSDDYYRNYIDEVKAIQKSDFQPIAEKHINGVPIIVIVGKAKKIKSQIDNVDWLKDAKIVEYDLDLNKKK